MTDLVPAPSTPSTPSTPSAPGTGSELPAAGERAAGRLLVVQHEDDAGLGRLARHLPPVDVRRPFDGDPLPADLDGVAGLLVLGGSMGAWDDDAAPWLPAVRRLLAEGVERQTPTLGICLGAQLLAAATGGRVERGAAGLEVGTVPIRLHSDAADDALLGPVAATAGAAPVTVTHWHQDAVTALPPGAVLLASGDRYPHQAFRLGHRAWGVQYHPEVTRAGFAAWMGSGQDGVREAGLDPERVLAGVSDADAALEVLAVDHARAFAALLSS